MVGDGDRLRLVLHHQHGVALVAQAQQQVVHPLDVMGVQSDGRLVEDVGDIGERGAEVPDHLGALRLAAGERARGPVEREIAEPDLHERVQGVTELGEQRRHRRIIDPAGPFGKVADLHRADVGDVDLADPRGADQLAEPGAVALGALGEGDRPVHEGPDVRLHRLAVLGEEGLLDLRDQPLIGEVDAVDLHLGRLAVQEVVPLLLGVLADRLLLVEEARLGDDPHHPAVPGVGGDGERVLGERLGVVEQLGEVDVGDLAPAFAVRAHAAGTAEGHLLRLGLVRAPVDRDPAARRDRGDVEGERAGRADVRRAEPAEEDAQHRVGVGGGADGGARVGSHALLVDRDRGGQPVEHVHLGPGEVRHEALQEGAVGLVDQPLRLRGDRVEHQRALARAGDAREHREPALRNLDADVLEVVLTRTVHADHVMAVGNVRPGRLSVRRRGLAHGVSICRSDVLSPAPNRGAERGMREPAVLRRRTRVPLV